MDAFPVEVMQEILQYFRLDFTSPTIGEDAVWNEPRSSKEGFPNLWSRKRHTTNGEQVSGNTSEPNLSSYRDVLSLRLVNRLFNETCTPFIYQELNIFGREDEADYEIATRYGKHVKLLRVGLIVNASDSNETGLIRVLSLCSNLQSIGLYYWRGHGHFSLDVHTPLVKEFLSAIRDRGLRFIGFHSGSSYNQMSGTIGYSDQHLLHELAKSDEAKLVKKLDVHFGGITANMYMLLRNQFTSLESLTIRGSLGSMVGPLWKDETYWGPYSNLTRLQLINCHNVYPPHIAELVRHFPSLEYFLMSTCGHGPPVATGREKGWSSQPDGWWNTRKPLKSMHIEHMLTWEMLVMGTIPALEITAVSLYAGDLARTFMHDHEVFPHLKLLRAAPIATRVFGGERNCENERILEDDLQAVCDARGIEFRRDAKWLIHTRYGRW
ncbi:hypothetical protein CPB86DRAFT_779005 [Serendipita vermifera]|nr:hypothetical protein CPB86DRAFT_779005 [Serendipita vermifera]